MTRIFLFLFLLVSAGDLVSTLVDVPSLELFCKPAIMITLGLYYWFTQEQKQNSISVVLLFAILFSFGGDVLLMLQQSNPLFFMLGLGSFLVAHIFYIITYQRHAGEENDQSLSGVRKIRYSFPVVFSGFALVTILYGHLGDLRIPVVVYAVVLSYMVLNALFRFGRTSGASFAMVFGGAILFMISDSLIAINKFLDPIPFAGFWIMSTYVAAQFLIVTGLIKHRD
jgi:uncharacterized membrane protein YhhN